MDEDRASDFTQLIGPSWTRAEGDSALRTALENLDLAVLVRTLDGRVVMVNSAFVGLLGYPREEVVGQDIRKFLFPEGRCAIDEASERIRSGQVTGLAGVIQMACRDETILHVKASVTTIARNGQTLVVGFLQDWSDILWADPAHG